ncbi:MAG: hypothetical protein ACLR7D_13295 [Lachnospira eligens]
MDLKATLEKFTKENEQLQMYARRMEIAPHLQKKNLIRKRTIHGSSG